jgi:hypothetical protein
VNLGSPKVAVSNKINLNDSYEKINEVITNFYGNCKEKKPSISKNADLIKRMKNRFEKGAKISDEQDRANSNSKGFNSLGFKTSYNGKGSVLDNWNKFDKKIFNSGVKLNENNLNSDILRLELMNLNCFSQKDINSIKGIDRFGSSNKRRTVSMLSGLEIL